MPIIKAYRCPSCGWDVESWHTEAKPHKPPLCPGCMIPCTQVFYPPGIILKGLGWGKDGYNKNIDDAENYWKKMGKPVCGDI
jgi:hypothetical protein